MQLNSIAIDNKSVIMRVTANKDTDDTNDLVESKITAKEEPLPSLTKAWAALPAVFCEIMELPPEYTEGLTITRLAIRRTKQGTRSVILHATKQLECRSEFLHEISAPCVQVDKAADGESGAVQIEKKMCTAITKVIHESERYLAGERSQTLLDFDQAKAGLQALADKGQDLLSGVGN
jgi:hypothetical protein